MATLDEWEQALAVPRRIIVESSPDLLREVRKRRIAKNRQRRLKDQTVPKSKRNITTLPQFSPEVEVETAPIRLLHKLGVVTTPPIENLVDLCSWWASLRYMWAFQLPVGPNDLLRLSEEARGIDFHQKGLLSDHIGIGAAATLMEDLGCPLSVDVSLASEDPTWPFEIGEDDPSPDYLFFNDDRSVVYVVECKGTQTQRSSSVDQIRRGLEQLSTVRFRGAPTPPGVVIATLLGDLETRIFLVDPSDEKPSKERLRKRSKKRIIKPQRLGQLAHLKSLVYAGETETVHRILIEAEVTTQGRIRRQPGEMATRQNRIGDFQGFEQRALNIDGNRITLFQGMNRDLIAAINRNDLVAVQNVLAGLERRRGELREDGGEQVIVDRGPNLTVSSASADGTLFEVRVQE